MSDTPEPARPMGARRMWSGMANAFTSGTATPLRMAAVEREHGQAPDGGRLHAQGVVGDGNAVHQ